MKFHAGFLLFQNNESDNVLFVGAGWCSEFAARLSCSRKCLQGKMRIMVQGMYLLTLTLSSSCFFPFSFTLRNGIVFIQINALGFMAIQLASSTKPLSAMERKEHQKKRKTWGAADKSTLRRLYLGYIRSTAKLCFPHKPELPLTESRTKQQSSLVEECEAPPKPHVKLMQI